MILARFFVTLVAIMLSSLALVQGAAIPTPAALEATTPPTSHRGPHTQSQGLAGLLQHVSQIVQAPFDIGPVLAVEEKPKPLQRPNASQKTGRMSTDEPVDESSGRRRPKRIRYHP